MSQSKIHPSVKSAIDAWQAGDLKLWLSHFTADARLYDDGSPRNFPKFSQEIGKERFTSFDKAEDDGCSIYGKFHSETWGEYGRISSLI